MFKSSIHNIAFSGENVILSESGEKYAQIKQERTVQNCSRQIWIMMWEDNREWTFSLEEALLWIYRL